jgi:hypothetical protein
MQSNLIYEDKRVKLGVLETNIVGIKDIKI